MNNVADVTLRECSSVSVTNLSYEAYALYNFFVLLVVFLEGERNLIPILEAKPRIPHPWPLCYFTFKPGECV
jgi:hypothetical protein